jgi:TRAP-type C4-dicarboxylate transport system permease small subunit
MLKEGICVTAILRKISETTNRVFIFMTVIFLSVVVVSSSLQVITRYVFNNALSWTEEMARYAFVWLIMSGASVATKNGTHATLDLIVQMLKGKLLKIHQEMVNLAILGIGFVLIFQSTKLLEVTSAQLSVAMRIPMVYAYLAIPVGAVGIVIHAFSNLFSLLLPQKENNSPTDTAG